MGAKQTSGGPKHTCPLSGIIISGPSSHCSNSTLMHLLSAYSIHSHQDHYNAQEESIKSSKKKSCKVHVRPSVTSVHIHTTLPSQTSSTPFTLSA